MFLIVMWCVCWLQKQRMWVVLLFGENAIGGFPLLAYPCLARRRDRREEGREYSMPSRVGNNEDTGTSKKTGWRKKTKNNVCNLLYVAPTRKLAHNWICVHLIITGTLWERRLNRIQESLPPPALAVGWLTKSLTTKRESYVSCKVAWKRSA